jgi:hypothetical protein
MIGKTPLWHQMHQKNGLCRIPFKTKATKPFLNAIRTRITQVDKRGTDAAGATTVDIPPWSDEKKQQKNFTM